MALILETGAVAAVVEVSEFAHCPKVFYARCCVGDIRGFGMVFESSYKSAYVAQRKS